MVALPAPKQKHWPSATVVTPRSPQCILCSIKLTGFSSYTTQVTQLAHVLVAGRLHLVFAVPHCHDCFTFAATMRARVHTQYRGTDHSTVHTHAQCACNALSIGGSKQVLPANMVSNMVYACKRHPNKSGTCNMHLLHRRTLHVRNSAANTLYQHVCSADAAICRRQPTINMTCC